MNSSSYVGVDLGGESGRVIVGSFDGRKIRLSEKHRFKTGGCIIDGALRWDVNRFWREIENGLSVAALEATPIVSVGVDTWGVDYVLLDADEQLLEVPYHYRDSRNAGMMEAVTQKVGRSEIFAQTGIQFMEINTLYQLAAHRKSSEVLDRAKHFLTIPDYFHWRLCGSKSVEFTNATTTQCLSPRTRSWASQLLCDLDIPVDIFPETINPGSDLGKIRKTVSSTAGLNDVSVVAPATHDTGSAVVAVPVDSSQNKPWAYISSGTWSLVGVEVDQPFLSPEALAANVTNEGGVDGTWRLLKNVMGLWIVQQTRRAFSQRGFERTYEELAQMATAATRATSFIDPDDPCFLNPENMEEAILKFCQRTNQPAPADEGSLIRCVLESLALKYSQVLNEIENLTGEKVEVIHVVGGGSQNRLLNQLIADATRTSVVAGPVEATVLGNVLMQCRSAGELGSLSEIRDVVRASSDLEFFNPSNASDWQDAIVSFEALCKN